MVRRLGTETHRSTKRGEAVSDKRFEELLAKVYETYSDWFRCQTSDRRDISLDARSALVAYFEERTKERDEARAEVCQTADHYKGCAGACADCDINGKDDDYVCTTREYAASRGWSYLYEVKP